MNIETTVQASEATSSWLCLLLTIFSTLIYNIMSCAIHLWVHVVLVLFRLKPHIQSLPAVQLCLRLAGMSLPVFSAYSKETSPNDWNNVTLSESIVPAAWMGGGWTTYAQLLIAVATADARSRKKKNCLKETLTIITLSHLSMTAKEVELCCHLVHHDVLHDPPCCLMQVPTTSISRNADLPIKTGSLKWKWTPHCQKRENKCIYVVVPFRRCYTCRYTTLLFLGCNRC